MNGKEEEDRVKVKEGVYWVMRKVVFVREEEEGEKVDGRIGVENEWVLEEVKWKEEGGLKEL